MANYTQNDVNFTDISTSLLAIGAKVTATPYQVDDGDNITFSLPIINAIDIDWNGADLGLIEKDVRSNDGIGRTQRVYS